MKWGFLASTVFCIIIALYLMNSVEPTAPAVQTETTASVETTTPSWEEIYHSVYSGKSEDAEALINNDSQVLPYLADVTGDGENDLILKYTSADDPGIPYSTYMCYVYRLDTMEQVSFHHDISALASMMIVKPEAYDYTARTYTFRIKYDERLFGDAPASFQESWEATIHSMPLSEAPSFDLKEYPVYVDINSLNLNYDPESMSFGAKFDIYADPNHTYPIDPVYVTYIWDEATNQFIMKLDSARIQLAG